MPTGKRASMREGPLAALFRKTAEETEDRSEAPAAQPPQPRPTWEPIAAAEPPAPPVAPEPEIEEPRIPLPHERLRHAFSADIPDNVLERSSSPPSREEPAAPEHDVCAAAMGAPEEPAARPTLGPVLRVVGVGGAGVNAINRMVEA